MAIRELLTTGFFEMLLPLPALPSSLSESMSDMRPDDEKNDSGEQKYWRMVVFYVLALINIWHLVAEQIERQERRELAVIKSELSAEVKSLRERLDDQLFREAEAKSRFDLFNEHYLKSRKQQ